MRIHYLKRSSQSEHVAFEMKTTKHLAVFNLRNFAEQMKANLVPLSAPKNELPFCRTINLKGCGFYTQDRSATSVWLTEDGFSNKTSLVFVYHLNV